MRAFCDFWEASSPAYNGNNAMPSNLIFLAFPSIHWEVPECYVIFFSSRVSVLIAWSWCETRISRKGMDSTRGDL